MGKNERNIYLTARLSSGLQQNEASEKLFISVATLRDYETGKRTPSDETTLKMLTAYNAKWLGYLHLRASPIGQIVLPEIVLTKGFASSVITLNRTVNNLVKAMNDLMDIAENEVVDNTKEDAYQKICKEIEANVAACMAILVNEHKKKNGSVAPHTVQGFHDK